MANPAFHRDGSPARHQDADADPCANEYAAAHSHRDSGSHEHPDSRADPYGHARSHIYRDPGAHVHGYSGAHQYRNADTDSYGDPRTNFYCDSRADCDPNTGAHINAASADFNPRPNTHRRWRKSMVGCLMALLLAGAAWAQENGPSEGVVIVPPQNTPVGTGTAGTLSAATAIAALPTCTAGNAGRFAQVDNQQNTPVWAQTPVATASAGIRAGVYCNGSNWTIFCK